MEKVILKIFLASICGGAIGLERESKNRNVGIRTYMTVCLSTAVVMIIATQCYYDTHTGDITRMASASLQGIGFLGAGLIIQKDDKLKGITTAAILWGTAIIGLAIGYGLYFVGIASTIAMIVIGNILIKRKYFEGNKNNPKLKNENSNKDQVKQKRKK